MKTNSFVRTALMLVASLIFLTSCKKDKNSEVTIDTDYSMASDNARAELEANNLGAAADAGYDQAAGAAFKNSATNLLPACATVTIDTVSSPKTLTVDFGTSNCLCSNWDGRYRRGKVKVSWTGGYRTPGTVITTSTEDYYVNDILHKYHRVVTNNGLNASGNPVFNVNVDTAKIYTTDGTISWTSNRTREWIAGDSTLNLMDDEYYITGSADGVSAKGTSFNVTITQALWIKLNCKWIVSGKLTVSPQNKDPRYVDYGTGACDSQVSVTINNKTYTFSQP